VREQLKGKGIGTEFLQLLVEHLLNKGYRYLHTDTADGNVGAQRFYEARGFQRRGCTRSYARV
jgi:RimJ/RimL family protein N-acetyltransferase